MTGQLVGRNCKVMCFDRDEADPKWKVEKARNHILELPYDSCSYADELKKSSYDLKSSKKELDCLHQKHSAE